MNRFTFPLYLAFITGTLLAGCTAPVHLRHRSHPSTSELSSAEKMQRTIAVWKDTHISKAIQKWGSPNEVTGDGTGWQTYTWQIPVDTFLVQQDHQFCPRNLFGSSGVVGGKYISTGYTYQLTFYTRPNGTVYKTDIKKEHDPASEFKWK